jgi:hypothetical protein
VLKEDRKKQREEGTVRNLQKEGRIVIITENICCIEEKGARNGKLQSGDIHAERNMRR